MSGPARLGLLSILCSALGCAVGTDSQEDVLFRPPLTRLELVHAGLKGADDPRWPRSSDGVPALYGGGPTIADDQCFGRVAEGRHYSVRVQAAIGQGGQPGIVLLGSSGNRIGEVNGFTVPARVESWWILAEWDPEGRQVAISFLERGGQWLAVLGLVAPPSLEFKELIRTEGKQWERSVWVGSRLILVYRDELVDLDAVDGSTTRLYLEDVRRSAPRDIGIALPSPDGAFLMFDRRPPWRADCGIWIFDLISSECTEVTYQSADTYTHGVLLWETPDRFLFSRVDHNGNWDIYRAYVSMDR